MGVHWPNRRRPRIADAERSPAVEIRYCMLSATKRNFAFAIGDLSRPTSAVLLKLIERFLTSAGVAHRLLRHFDVTCRGQPLFGGIGVPSTRDDHALTRP